MNSNHCSSLEVRGEPLCWACSSGQRLDETGSGRGIDSTQKSITILDKCPRANEHWWKPDILSVLCYKTGKQRNSLFPGALQIVEVSNSRKHLSHQPRPRSKMGRKKVQLCYSEAARDPIKKITFRKTASRETRRNILACGLLSRCRNLP
ncbi:uncharacterized protein LOC125753982 isoform X3 [Canis lupus dingo]|uniref:uncharacterized protein LOC125753982 isoform X3 n=1 Tax=Canis lupus dingo TaxID=286419 RepID=UPI0020C58A7F|nr:uncharacterized protein LOC125753982 isoform X3 [Canis lupus dingo]